MGSVYEGATEQHCFGAQTLPGHGRQSNDLRGSSNRTCTSLRIVGIPVECMRPRLPHTLCSHTAHLAPVPSTGTKVCRPCLYTRAPSSLVLRSVLGLYQLHPSYHNQARDYEGRTFHYHSKVSLHLNHPSYDIQKSTMMTDTSNL